MYGFCCFEEIFECLTRSLGKSQKGILLVVVGGGGSFWLVFEGENKEKKEKKINLISKDL